MPHSRRVVRCYSDKKNARSIPANAAIETPRVNHQAASL